MLIHNKDYIEFVTEFPCLLGHPVLVVYTVKLAIGAKWSVRYFYTKPKITM